MRFIHMSDLHYKKEYKDYGFDSLIAAKQHPEENFRNCIRKEKKKGLDFVLITGDITHEGDEEDNKALKELLETELGDIPYVVLPGNHDKRDAFKKVFQTDRKQENIEVLEESIVDAVYNIDGLKVITIDTGRSINGIVKEEQVKWLSEVLKEDATKGFVLALHHPLLDKQEGLDRALYPKSFVEVIHNSNILGIFCGHTHHNFISQFAGKPYFTADSMAFTMIAEDNTLTYLNSAAYTCLDICDNIITGEIKQVVSASAVIASFSSDKLSQLFNE